MLCRLPLLSFTFHEISVKCSSSAQWQSRYQFHQYRMKKEQEQAPAQKTSRHSGSTGSTGSTGRQQSSPVEQPSDSNKQLASSVPQQDAGFSRANARAEIAAAVARVKTRRSSLIASNRDSDANTNNPNNHHKNLNDKNSNANNSDETD